MSRLTERLSGGALAKLLDHYMENVPAAVDTATDDLAERSIDLMIATFGDRARATFHGFLGNIGLTEHKSIGIAASDAADEKGAAAVDLAKIVFFLVLAQPGVDRVAELFTEARQLLEASSDQVSSKGAGSEE